MSEIRDSAPKATSEKSEIRLCSDCRLTPVGLDETQCVACKRLIEQRNAFDNPQSPVPSIT